MLDLLDDAPAHKVDDLLAPAAHLGAERRRWQRRDEEDGAHRMPTWVANGRWNLHAFERRPREAPVALCGARAAAALHRSPEGHRAQVGGRLAPSVRAALPWPGRRV
jgi:hypothetical protein